MAIPLKCIEVSETIFDDIVKTMASRIIVVKSIKPYCAGYPKDMSKKFIVYDKSEYLIMQEYLFAYFAGLDENHYTSSWKQIKVRRSKQTQAWEDSIDGPRAYNFMMNLLRKHYTDEEIEACFKAHEAEYDNNKIQYHHFISGPTSHIIKYPNCYKYDINGAHQDALVEIFPKAAKDLLEIYNQRKSKPIYKKYMNFFVGELCKKSHRLTYNWIVQRTTGKLMPAIHKCGGTLLYANTDGFVVHNPDNLLDVSTKLGDFKLEYSGTVCTYRGKNYNCFELSDLPEDSDKRVNGTLRLCSRHLVNLAQGKVVTYDIIKTRCITHTGDNLVYDEVNNITQEERPIYEENC